MCHNTVNRFFGRAPVVFAVLITIAQVSVSTARAQAPEWTIDATAFEHSHNVTAAVLSGQTRLSGSDHRLAAFVGDEIRGVATPTQVANQWLFFLTIHGETSGERVTFRVYDAGAGGVFPVSQSLDFSINGITGSPSSPFWLEMATSTNSAPELAPTGELRLYQNAPNPFIASTEIAFDLPTESHVFVEVFDLSGRRVRTVLDDYRPPGTHSVRFDAADLPAGAYLYRISTDKARQTRLMFVAR